MQAKIGIVVLLLALSSLVSAPAWGQAHTQTVNLYVRKCLLINSNTEILTVVGTSGKEVLSKPLPLDRSVLLQHVQFEVVPGTYTVGVSAGRCSAGLAVSVLPNRDRNIALLTTTKVFLNQNVGSMFGFLPSPGWRVFIVFKDRTARRGQISSPDGWLQIPATVEGDAYYAVNLPDGDATVRLYDQSSYNWTDFRGGTIAPGSRSIRRDVTGQDLTL